MRQHDDVTADKYLTEHTIAEVVDTSLCFVAKYGRPLSVPKVQRLARSFELEAVGSVYLSLRADLDYSQDSAGKEKYAILDGQHRIAAARLRGVTKLPALVFIDLTYEQEAALYVKFATVNPQSSLDKFKARVEAKEPRAMDIVDLLSSIGGLQISAGQVSGGIQAVTVIENLYNRFGRAHLRSVLTTCYRAWQGHPRAYTHPILNGLSAFIRNCEPLTIQDDGVKLDWSRLVQTLQSITPETLIAKASQLRGILGQVSANNDSVGRVILLEYNKGLSKKRLPDWTNNTKRSTSESLHCVVLC